MSLEDLSGTVVRKICMACNREYAGIEGSCPHDGNLLVPIPQDSYLHKTLAGKYQIQEILGTGGMAVVYKAKHDLMDRMVAIKMLRAQVITEKMSVKRFQQEAKAASRLHHPNVITLFDFGVTETGQPYLVMDLLYGKSLAQEIKEKKQISVDRCIQIFAQACDALDHAHKQGVIHRDIKPGNIMLVNVEEVQETNWAKANNPTMVEDSKQKEPSFVKVVDFGVAKLMPINSEEAQTLTQAGEVCGSPVYMSPEQCLGHDLDARADIYSMGVVLYEALTGRPPLLGKNMVETMSKHLYEDPLPFSEVRPDLYIPERMESIVLRALSKDPYLRQQSMAELAQDIRFAVPRPGQALQLRIDSLTDVASSVRKNKMWLIPALVTLLLVLLIGVSIFVWSTVKYKQKVVRTTLPNVVPLVKTGVVQQTPPANITLGAGRQLPAGATKPNGIKNTATKPTFLPIRATFTNKRFASRRSNNALPKPNISTNKSTEQRFDSLAKLRTYTRSP